MGKFVRALVTALVESQLNTSVDGSTVTLGDNFDDRLKKHIDLVRKIVDCTDILEIQCLYALQALSVRHQHPKGLLEKSFFVFYDSEVVTEDAFHAWVASNDPAELDGKGVCVNSVKSFLNWLQTADVEEPDSQP